MHQNVYLQLKETKTCSYKHGCTCVTHTRRTKSGVLLNKKNQTDLESKIMPLRKVQLVDRTSHPIQHRVPTKKSVQLYKLLWLWLYKCHNHFLASSAKQVQQVLQG